MMVLPSYEEALQSFSLPSSHEGLEKEIHRIQDTKDPLTAGGAKNIEPRIAKVVYDWVDLALTTAQQVKPLYNIASLKQAAFLVVQDNDKKLIPDERFPPAMASLQGSLFGREMMLRVLLAISSMFSNGTSESMDFK